MPSTMTKPNQSLASLARLRLSTPCRPITQTAIPRVFAPAAMAHQKRNAANSSKSKTAKPKTKLSAFYPTSSLAKLPQYSLFDAMRCLRAWEVGQNPFTIRYDLAIKLKTLRNAPPVRNKLLLPHPLSSDRRRIGVICKEGSALAAQATEAGAVAAGQESMFAMIRDGKVNFTAIICHSASEEAMKRANIGRILGPKGLMPSAKLGTVTPDVVPLIQEMAMAEMYREKDGVVRFAIGQLMFSPDMLGDNIKHAVQQVREDCNALIAQSAEPKSVFEVVLSTTHGPGFSLNGELASTDPSITPQVLMSQL